MIHWIVLMLFSLFSDEKRLPNDHVRGTNHAHIHRRACGYGSETSKQELASLKRLGFNWIAITPFAYQPTAASNALVGFEKEPFDSKDRSMTDDDLIAEISNAHQVGLKVAMKPHIWAGDFWNGNEWHGTVRQNSPSEHQEWWKTYCNFILHYARVAEKGNADAVILGTELVLQSVNESEWRELIREIRQVFHGHLSYAAHWDKEAEQIQFWDALDCIGVNAYYPLQAPVNPTLEQLVQAWEVPKARLRALSTRWKKDVVFLEIGYRPVKETHLAPWAYSGGEPDLNAQSRAYEALFTSFYKESWWKGLFIWKTFTDSERADKRGDGTDFIFRNRPAESVIAQWLK